MRSLKVKRRSFLTGAAAAATAGVASPAIAQSMPEIRWRLTSSVTKALDTLFGASEYVSKYVAEATDNRFQIQPFAAGEIVGTMQAFDAVSSAAVECSHTLLSFYVGKDNSLAFATGIPFGLNARQQHSWWHFGGGEKFCNSILAKYNLYGLVCGNAGCQMGGFFRKEVHDLNDIKGLKFRIGGLGGQVFAKLGAVPQQIPPGDIYPALERGTIDAAELVGPADDEKVGLQKVAKYYYYPAWWEGGTMIHLIVNLAKWNELPKSYKTILSGACEAANNWVMGRYDALNPPALRRLVAGGAELRPFPNSIMEGSLKAANELFAEISAKNPEFKQGLDSLTAFRSESLPWWQISDLTYDTFMVRTRGRG